MKLICVRDIVAAAAVLMLCVALWLIFSSGSGKTAVVVCDGEVLRRIDLTSVGGAYEFEAGNDIKTVIRVENGAIGFVSSGCAEQICVRAGMIGKKGQTAVCAPARVSIFIEGGADAVTG